jgi:hypothetical protein
MRRLDHTIGEKDFLECGPNLSVMFTAPIDYRGDFNCVLTNSHCTGNINYSKALEKIVRGLDLVDVWGTVLPRAVYTHYTPHGAARLDLIYVRANLSEAKVRVETVFAGFTFHLAVCLLLRLEVPHLQRGRGLL